MNRIDEEFTNYSDTRYRLAEQKAAHYFSSLHRQVKEKTYVPVLTKDIEVWKRNHVRHRSWWSYFSRGKQKPDTRDYHRYLGWLNYTGKLDDYLDRSVSYIYMRDLGKALDSPGTKDRIRQMVTGIKTHLLHSGRTNQGDQPEFMSLAGFYRWAQKEGVETAAIWVIDKLKSVSVHIPKELNAEQAQRKLIKIIVGVVLHVIEEMGEETPPGERSRRLDEAIRLGYSYGLTYPFIDDLLDSQLLTAGEKERYSRMIRTALLTGIVPELGGWTGENVEFIRYVHSELRDAFEFIKGLQRPETVSTFFEQSYVFFQSQDIDRDKDLSCANYTNEELYIPVILKSASSRLIVRSVIHAEVDEGFDHRTFYYGIYNQLADDFADMFDDMEGGAVTPYTYYLKYRNQRPDLINPYELYWTVICHLIQNVYRSDAKTREVILDRAINGLKRCKERLGDDKYNEIMDIFASGDPEFHHLVGKMVRKAEDVDFFDKLLRDQMNAFLKKDQQEKEDFQAAVRTVRDQINSLLPIGQNNETQPVKDTLADAANYSLEGDGKRLRPILTWVMGVNEYGLNASAIAPLLRSLEYMHTASLIFDDLPSQDNASTRRGRSTLHEVYDSATAELTGLFLIQRAIKEQASLDRFDAKAVLTLMHYSAGKAEEICRGQAMDLQSKGKALSLAELNMLCFYKTGAAFEASLVMPAILAQVEDDEIEALKTFAYHAGIAFQIKDDLLDVEGDLLVLGKPTRQDTQNNSSTFVSVLGLGGARKEMWEHYCLAVEALREVPRNTAFLKHLLDYLVNRDR
ncbi:polyprenyl synthetase family protein [Paenibacillus sp. 7124]|uniref:Polyprenyl synthetase family protein n=2 Tax=Paenibacillus apii TaxID=1850370 RepID=A0A6M1PQ97_9BACL|nr:polyprenyl synthetase family protein [Paenibacillus apii]NGM84222.1 polyprenyl synthetase family protein [Paenibacillus apii]NJJ40882.1 polyprenyl synthetase family protein [Paenibacillus apii]